MAIVLGVVAIAIDLAPFHFYFPLLPIGGCMAAMRALAAGRIVGGIIGLLVNIVALGVNFATCVGRS